MLLLLIDIMSILTVGLLTIPAWFEFLFDSLGSLFGGGAQ